jgi:hypothetical protein
MTALASGACGASAAVPGADPLLVWADATGCRDFVVAGAAPPARLRVAVEVAAGAAVPAGVRVVAPRFGLADVDSAELARWLGGHGPALRRIELAMPVIPGRPRLGAQRPGAAPASSRATPAQRAVTPVAAPLLLGVVDTGCPFAGAHLRDAADRPRVRALWDQDETPGLAAGAACAFVPQPFGYGAALDGAALDALVDGARDAAGRVDEAACYRAAGSSGVAGRLSHGAAVLAQLAAAPVRGSGCHPAADRPPAWDATGDAAATAPIVFVQMPRADVQDSSSAALVRHVLDGLAFIVAHAVPGVTRRIVVNVSDGTSRTAHDGSSIVEQAIAALVDDCRSRGIELVVVVAAGNSFDEERHVQWDSPLDGAARAVLRLPPGSETAAFVSVRLPPLARGLRLRVTPPRWRGAALEAGVGEAVGARGPNGPITWGIVHCAPLPGQAALALIAFAPTLAHDAAVDPAPAGDWTVALAADAQACCDGPVHLWVSRNRRNLGALDRARQARFVDVGGSYDPQRELRRAEDDAQPPASAMRRAGTINGLATGRGVVVAGAYTQRRRGEPASRYSAAGPAAGAGRRGPDVSPPGDESPALPGLAVRGNLSGTVTRVIGTSFTAPLAARAIANGAWSPGGGGAADARLGERLRP